MDHFVYTSAGDRPVNEDAVRVKELADGGLYVLADGLGGHRDGALASACAAEALTGAESPEPGEETGEWLSRQIAGANGRLLALQQEQRSNMKSTIAALYIRNRTACWANVGDSRLYYIHRGELMAVTEDHSVSYKKYAAGEITREQIGQDEDQSRLLRVLGTEGGGRADLASAEEPEAGDGFLLCSDGLWAYLRDQEVLVDFLKSSTAKEWAEGLLLRVMERVKPGNDNLSLITVCVTWEDEKGEDGV